MFSHNLQNKRLFPKHVIQMISYEPKAQSNQSRKRVYRIYGNADLVFYRGTFHRHQSTIPDTVTNSYAAPRW